MVRRGEGRGGRCKGWCRIFYSLDFGGDVVGWLGKGIGWVGGGAGDEEVRAGCAV